VNAVNASTPVALALVAGAYLLGSVPFGLVLSRAFAGVDVRQVGSGNIGATNVSRAAGKGAGILTLVLDAAKGALPVLVAERVLGPMSATPAGRWEAAAGLAAFLGHIFPLWLGFRGGKGVATALGVSLAFAPCAGVAGMGAFAATVALTRLVSLGSLVGTAVVAGGTILRHGGLGSPIAWASLAMGAAIYLRHRGNIARLLRGEERKL
jgi:acyl phosphate:glycerol-3-phosphate acyltransferase